MSTQGSLSGTSCLIAGSEVGVPKFKLIPYWHHRFKTSDDVYKTKRGIYIQALFNGIACCKLFSGTKEYAVRITEKPATNR